MSILVTLAMCSGDPFHNRWVAKVAAKVKETAGRMVRLPGVVGLAYHRIGDGRTSVLDRGLWSADCDRFDQQLRWLKEHCDVISPGDLPDVVRRARGRHALVTFDDGYADNYAAAYPILRARGLSATFFVATGFVDRPCLPWWDEIAWMVRSSPSAGVVLPGYIAQPITYDEPDRERAVRRLLRTYKKLPIERTGPFLEALGEASRSGRHAAGHAAGLWMTWDMLREMRAGGMTIGGHTVNHPILSLMSREAQWKEISGCGQRLREELGAAMQTFSYPIGHRDSFNSETRACLREAGVRSAFSYYGGIHSFPRWDDYDIRRTAVEHDMTFEEFRASAMAPWLNLR